jgi:oligopeptide transport system substrate-binding protein
MRVTARKAATVAAIAAVGLLASACSDSGEKSPSASAGASGGDISYAGCTPQNPFIPANTNETCGGDFLDTILAKAVHYNPETAAPEMDLATKIESTDNQNFTVTLNKGRKFQDGTEVKAKNFVDAWNWNRNGVNGTLNSYFFDPIEGSADMDCGTFDKDQGTGDNDPKAGDPDCKGKPPKAKTLSGLKVVDDYTFTIKTTEKVSNLPVRLGYTAFAPLPDSFFTDDGAAFGKKPIGAGPYKFVSYEQGTSMVVEKDPNYGGKFAGKADKITFKIYTDAEAAYKDVQAGQTDIQSQVPSSALPGEKYKSDLPDRTAEKAVGTFASISFPSPKADKTYSNPKLRAAISMAIDRDTLIKQIFAGTKEPATGWVSPVVDGYKADACGENCKFDPAKAKALFDEAGGYKGKMTLSYNVNGDHKAWTEAVCNMLKENLGVDAVAVGVTEFSTFRGAITDEKMKGMFRTGWQMDYPSIENFLAPLYGTGAGSNDSHYSNPAFDKLITEAAAQTSLDAANAKYQEAEALLKNDMPVIPMWYGKVIAGWDEKVSNVKITPFGTVDLTSVTVK